MPNLIYIYNYLENKLSSDILCIIINNYLSLFTTKQLNKYSINNHLKYYISTSNIRKDANNKFYCKWNQYKYKFYRNHLFFV